MQLLVKIVRLWIQRHFQDPTEYLRWSSLQKKLTASAVHYFCKKLHLICSEYVLNTFWILNTVLNKSLKVLITFTRTFILDVWLDFRYFSDKVAFSFGWNSESNYIEWWLSRGVLMESCFGNLILSQIHVRNVLSQ